MAKKKSTALEQQVVERDSITIEDCKQFIVDAKEKRKDFMTVADRSWNEVEKKNKLGKLYGGNDLDRARRWTKFPLWWSCWKIRQPITLARMAIPVLKDTQGDDPYGRTACIVGERLTKGILKTFEAFSEFSASNDDFLVTNFGWGRWNYSAESVLEEEKLRLQVVQPEPPPMEGQMVEGAEAPMPMGPIFVTPDGQEVDQAQVLTDDLGPYLATGQMVSVDNERVYFGHGLYSGLLVDPDAVRWNKVTRLVFEYPYSYREFKAKFGQKALDKLAQADIKDHKSGKKPIIVYEYHDSILKEVRWFAENSEDFFQPSDMEDANLQALTEQGKPLDGMDHSDLYGLSNFFPCTEPLVINQSTRCFWPTPEYFQVEDIINDISSIVTRMMQLTRAIRVRFLFDSGVKALSSLIGENWADGEGTGMGVPNLQQSLMNNKGSLAALVAYFPIDELLQGLQNMYAAYEQRLSMFYNITGFSDLIRGQTSDSDKTYGERQLEGKFALNRMEPFQRKVQEWVKDNYQLGMELALKMFSDQTLDDYICPQTLDPEDKQRYTAALDLLRNNRRGRFRIDFETDSTISINQDWKKKQAIETANAITKMMESTAKTAQEMPELADAELRIMKHVVGELTDGKLFLDEITDAIQKTIDAVNQPKEPEPNVEMEKLKLEMRKQEFAEQKAMTEDRLQQLQMQMDQGIESAKIAQKERLDGFALQLEQIKMQNEAGAAASEINLKAQALQAELSVAQQEIAASRVEFMLKAREIADKTELKQLELLINKATEDRKAQLDELYAGVEAQQAMLAEREKWVTEMRLQDAHKVDIAKSMVEMEKTMKEMRTSPTPVVVHLEQPKAKKKKRTGRVVRDAAGDATHIEIDEEEVD